MPTIKEVAKLSGMSLATVSMVLRGGVHAEKFSKATRTKVADCAQQLGYRRNFFASQIRPTARKVLMMYVDSITDAGQSATAERFERRAAERGYKTLMAFQDEPDRQTVIDREVVGRHGISAVALLCRVTENTIAELANEGVSVVLFDRESDVDTVSTVLTDHYSGTMQVAEHLYNQNVENVWLLCRPFSKSSPIVRVTAFEEYAGRIGKPKPREICANPMSSAEASVKEGCRAFTEALQDSAPPDAVFAINDMGAYGAIRALYEAGYLVGRDVAMVGYGDLWPSQATVPPLTTVHVPHAEMGEVGADILIDTVEGNIRSGRKVVLAPQLVIRDSGFVNKSNSGSRQPRGSTGTTHRECTLA